MIELDFFELEEYRNYDKNHVNVINELMSDQRSNKFLGDIRFMIQMINKRREENHVDNFYIAKKNGDYVGFISLSIIEDRYEVSIGLLPKFRGQNLAYLLTQDFIDHVFTWYPEVDSIYARIKPDNIGSIRAAEMVGFKMDEDGRYVIGRAPKMSIK